MKKLPLSIYLAALVLPMNAHADNPPSQKLRIGCLMMASAIEAVDEEHIDYPDESRDDIVARFVTLALASAQGQVMPADKLIEIGGHFVDYVEVHPGLATTQLKQQFMKDCTSLNLPW